MDYNKDKVDEMVLADPALDAEVEQLWIAEAQRRYEAFLRGELEALPGDEVMARARSRSQRQRREM